MAASFVHLQVSREAIKQVFSNTGHDSYRKVIDEFLHFVLLGSVSPDYPYLASKITGVDRTVNWGDKLHNVRASTNVQIGLRLLAAEADKGSDRFFMKLAWLMGYYSHVMTDVVVHPVVYRIIKGPYAVFSTQHTECEISQDSIMCHVMLKKEITDVDYLKPLENCTDESRFSLDLAPTHKVIKEPVSNFWKSILKENYPDEYRADEPNVDAWHRAFLELMPMAREGRYIFGKLPFSTPYTYNKFEDIPIDERDRTFFSVDLPNKRTGNYQTEVFDKAVNVVRNGWDNLLNSITNLTDLITFNGTLKPWNLDDGTTDKIDYDLWAGGKTTDVYPVA